MLVCVLACVLACVLVSVRVCGRHGGDPAAYVADRVDREVLQLEDLKTQSPVHKNNQLMPAPADLSKVARFRF